LLLFVSRILKLKLTSNFQNWNTITNNEIKKNSH
jgi:hypothetical protein